MVVSLPPSSSGADATKKPLFFQRAQNLLHGNAGQNGALSALYVKFQEVNGGNSFLVKVVA